MTFQPDRSTEHQMNRPVIYNAPMFPSWVRGLVLGPSSLPHGAAVSVRSWIRSARKARLAGNSRRAAVYLAQAANIRQTYTVPAIQESRS